MESRKKVVFVGDSGCGKSSIISMLNKKKLPKKDAPNVLEDHFFDIVCCGDKVTLHIRDTAGNSDSRFMSYRNAEVIILCFSLDNPSSLEKIPEKWIPELQLHCPAVRIVLVGNKKDLQNDPVLTENDGYQEPITTEDGRAMAIRTGAFAYLECSAKLNERVFEVFEAAARVVTPLERSMGMTTLKRQKKFGKRFSLWKH